MKRLIILSACVVLSLVAGPAAAAERVFVLSGFEPGGPDFVKGDGTVVPEPALGGTEGKNACKLESDEQGYRGLDLSDREALGKFKDYRWLKADVFVPGDAGISYGVRLDDARSRDYNSRCNLDGRWAPAGKSQMIVDLKFLRRSGNFLSQSLDLASLKQVKIFLGPQKDKRAIYFDNVRLEGSPDDKPVETTIFDFENDADLSAWSPLAAEPKVLMALSADGATSGKRALKLTYAPSPALGTSGGRLPTVTCARIPVDDWLNYPAIKADITVSRDCAVLIRVLREKSERAGAGRWEKLCRLYPGKNTVVEVNEIGGASFAALGKVVAVDIALYEPRAGESIFVDNVRLVDSYPEATTAYRYMNPTVAGGKAFFYPWFPKPDAFKVLGTDWSLYDMDALTDKLKGAWVKPEPRTLDQVEAAFRARFDELKKTHPNAVCVTLREGDKGFDPANPDKLYAGWSDAYVGGHDPAPAYIAAQLGARMGGGDKIEMFLRRRGALLRADLSSIPKGANILAAQLVLVKADKPQTEGPYSILKPAFLYCEPCNRPWVESEMNGVEYAKGKFWKEIDGMDWRDADPASPGYAATGPDFPPLIVAYGQAGYNIDTLDFTEAVRYWTSGEHANNGWVMCSPGTAMEYTHIWSREAANVRDRPALMIVYEPK
jgi:hypothetical protein